MGKLSLFSTVNLILALVFCFGGLTACKKNGEGFTPFKKMKAKREARNNPYANNPYAESDAQQAAHGGEASSSGNTQASNSYAESQGPADPDPQAAADHSERDAARIQNEMISDPERDPDRVRHKPEAKQPQSKLRAKLPPPDRVQRVKPPERAPSQTRAEIDSQYTDMFFFDRSSKPIVQGGGLYSWSNGSAQPIQRGQYTWQNSGPSLAPPTFGATSGRPGPWRR